jgi:transposase
MDETKVRKKNYNYFIGTDVSRNKLDHAVMKGKQFLFHRETKNEPAEIAAFVAELKTLPGFMVSRSVFCLEHTGLYGQPLMNGLKKVKANIVIEDANQIRNSLGNMRGKNDKLDAMRIAEYAYSNREKLRFWVHKRPVIQQLAELITLRTRLNTIQGAIATPLKELEQFSRKKTGSESSRFCQHTLNALARDRTELESHIAGLIQADERLRQLMALVTSVHCIGPVTALQIIVSTNEFIDINNPKKFACYAGVAPFTKESGNIKAKSRVSHMANKKVKALLHICALSAVTRNTDLRVYYLRKTEVEGKHKMKVLNAIRYKLILRVFACVNQNRLYERNYVRETTLSIAET